MDQMLNKDAFTDIIVSHHIVIQVIFYTFYYSLRVPETLSDLREGLGLNNTAPQEAEERKEIFQLQAKFMVSPGVAVVRLTRYRITSGR